MNKNVAIHLRGSVLRVVLTEERAADLQRHLKMAVDHPRQSIVVREDGTFEPIPALAMWIVVHDGCAFNASEMTGYSIWPVEESSQDEAARAMVKLAKRMESELGEGEDWKR